MIFLLPAHTVCHAQQCRTDFTKLVSGPMQLQNLDRFRTGVRQRICGKAQLGLVVSLTSICDTTVRSVTPD